MNCDILHRAIRQHGHPPMPQAWLDSSIEEVMVRHDQGDDIIPVSPCVLLALLFEIEAYRNQHGLLRLPADDDYYYVP